MQELGFRKQYDCLDRGSNGTICCHNDPCPAKHRCVFLFILFCLVCWFIDQNLDELETCRRPQEPLKSGDYCRNLSRDPGWASTDDALTTIVFKVILTGK